jgi:hypothetical protein
VKNKGNTQKIWKPFENALGKAVNILFLSVFKWINGNLVLLVLQEEVGLCDSV